MVLVERARAKINLTLHVLGRRTDGYHDLDSLVAFAAVADEVSLEPDRALGLSLRGPMARATGEPAENLVLKAARALADLVPGLRTGAFALVKRLPVAAGLGGGSADAGAALRLLARANGLAPDDPRLAEAARLTGADVPVCLLSEPRRMAGTGDRLGDKLDLPRLPALLVNPGRPTLTPAVFRALGLAPGERLDRPAHPERPMPRRRDDMLALLAAARNDLEAPAIAVEASIGLVLAELAALDGARFVRMSGSGASCFALFDNCRASASAARTLRSRRPDWWIRPTMIG